MNRSSWNSSVVLSEKAINELKYWFTSLDRINESGATLSQLTKEDVSSIVVYCDASDTGFGGHLTMGSDIEQTESECYGVWKVIPEWKSAPFWSMLIDMKGNFNTYVKTHSKMHNVHAICRGMGNNGIFGKRNLTFNMIFLKIEF